MLMFTFPQLNFVSGNRIIGAIVLLILGVLVSFWKKSFDLSTYSSMPFLHGKGSLFTRETFKMIFSASGMSQKQKINWGTMGVMWLMQVFFGIKFVSKLGLIFFAVVLYTMLSFYLGLGLAPRGAHPPSLTGLSWTTFKSNWSPGYPEGKSFSTAVALFFPCFTGILRYFNIPIERFSWFSV